MSQDFLAPAIFAPVILYNNCFPYTYFWLVSFIFDVTKLTQCCPRQSGEQLNKKTSWAPNEQANTVSRNFSFSRRYCCKRETKLSRIHHSLGLRGHGVGLVNDYTDTTMTIQALWMLLTHLKGHSGENKYLGVFTYPLSNSNNLKIWKWWVTVFGKSLTKRTRDYWTLNSNIFTKRKKFAKPFYPVTLSFENKNYWSKFRRNGQ